MNPTDLVILICLLLSAFFSGMEIAFVSSNRIYLEIEKLQQGLTSNVLKNITQNPSRFIASMLLGNNIALVVSPDGIRQFDYTDSSGLTELSNLAL